jgi:hypothetical protein
MALKFRASIRCVLADCSAVLLIFNLEPRLPGNERRMSAPDALGKSDGTLRPLLSVALRLLVDGVLEYRDRVGFAFLRDRKPDNSNRPIP